MPEVLRCCRVFCLVLAAVVIPAGAKPLLIRDVQVAPAFFNPSLQQVATLSFTLASAGEASVVVVDRDGMPIRALLSRTRFAAGRHTIAWNGRTDEGEIVADEAWSFKIDLRGGSGGRASASYFPAASNASANMVEIAPDSWDPVSGILRYKLPFPARVHVQAGSAAIDPQTKSLDGPVMKTIVNREPRIGGAVIEQWDGFDESRTIRVTDLPHFVVGIAATPLPASSVITVGNRQKTFVSTIATRRGRSLLPEFTGAHTHHQGLTAIEDFSPPLRVDVRNAKWSATERKWVSSASELDVSATAAGPTAAAFVAQRGGVLAFIDGKRVKVLAVVTQNPVQISIPVGKLGPGNHILAINWGSPYGPVAVNSFRFATSAMVSR